EPMGYRRRGGGWAFAAILVAMSTAVGPAAMLQAADGPVTRAVPLVRGWVTTAASARVPDEATCLRTFGFRCYVPAQLVHAYGLDRLSAAGLDGRGRTIVIVDSFGSPTIRADLHTF